MHKPGPCCCPAPPQPSPPLEKVHAQPAGRACLYRNSWTGRIARRKILKLFQFDTVGKVAALPCLSHLGFMTWWGGLCIQKTSAHPRNPSETCFMFNILFSNSAILIAKLIPQPGLRDLADGIARPLSMIFDGSLHGEKCQSTGGK